MSRHRSQALAPAVLVASALGLRPGLAAAGNMDGLGGAAMGLALMLAMGASAAAGLVTLIIVVVDRRRTSVLTQALARVVVIFNLVGHAGLALTLKSFAPVLIPGAVLGLVAGVIAWRTKPPVDADGQPVASGRLAWQIGAGLVAAAALSLVVINVADRQRVEAEAEALDHAQALLRDPSAPVSARLEALRLVQGPSRGACKLDGLDLSDLPLAGQNFDGCTLDGTKLSGDLSEIYVLGLDLSGAELDDVTLRGARLEEANLSGLDLRGVDLRGAQLRDADLSNANLEGAVLDGAYMAGCNLGGAKVSVEQLIPTESFYGIEGLPDEVVRAVERAQFGDPLQAGSETGSGTETGSETGTETGS